VPGAVIPSASLAQGDFLTDRLGDGFTLLCFGDAPALTGGPDLSVLALDPSDNAAVTLGATAGSAWLIRPDLHIAARWHSIPSDNEVQAAMDHVTARQRART
jgi:3-(3-hydroxy-phenyl)propionate hydroxylase